MVEPSSSQQKIIRVIKWPLYLSVFDYNIKHVHGSWNTLADIMTGWMRKYRAPLCLTRLVAPTKSSENSSLVHTTTSSQEHYFRLDMITHSQEKSQNKPHSADIDEDCILQVNDKMWIPADADSLSLRHPT